MKRRLGFIPGVFLLLIFSLYAAENPYVAGTIADVQQKVHTRTLYYIVNTPITRDDPYFEVSIQIKEKIYIGEYTPRHSADNLPEAWKADAEVKVRLEKHSMFLKRPDGEELEFGIIRHTAAPVPSQAPQPAPPKK